MVIVAGTTTKPIKGDCASGLVLDARRLCMINDKCVQMRIFTRTLHELLG